MPTESCEPKSMVFEKYAKNGKKKKYLLSLFSILRWKEVKYS